MTTPDETPRPDAFTEAQAVAPVSLPAELWLFLKTNKKWWLTPMILVILLVGALVFLGGSAAAPFIYTLF